jgi:hypothetical protein
MTKMLGQCDKALVESMSRSVEYVVSALHSGTSDRLLFPATGSDSAFIVPIIVIYSFLSQLLFIMLFSTLQSN